MRRPFVITTCAVGLALASAVLVAQTQPPATPPAAAQPEKPKEPRLAFSGDAGILLFQVKPVDPAAYGAGAAVLIVVGLAAAVLAARKATRIDPAAVLRA